MFILCHVFIEIFHNKKNSFAHKNVPQAVNCYGSGVPTLVEKVKIELQSNQSHVTGYYVTLSLQYGICAYTAAHPSNTRAWCRHLSIYLQLMSLQTHTNLHMHSVVILLTPLKIFSNTTQNSFFQSVLLGFQCYHKTKKSKNWQRKAQNSTTCPILLR